MTDARPSALWVKVCGVTSGEDARFVVDAGVSAIGLNFASESPRFLTLGEARSVRIDTDGVEWVGVFVNADRDFILERVDKLRLDWVQLHGDEPEEFARSLGVPVYKALPIGGSDDAELARRFAGDRILVDARVPGVRGGSGEAFDWSLVAGVARDRRLVLAGGLRPTNVAEAVRAVRPFGVDTASGVESSPGKKDRRLVAAFVRAARDAAGELPDG